jgi:hypothetical protein
MHGGGGFGGMHGGGFGGMHAGGGFAGMRGGGGFAGMHPMGGRMSFASIGPGPRFAGPGFAGPRFAGPRFAGRGFSPRFSHAAFPRNRFFFHHRFRRFAFFGVPFGFADYGYYDGCWRRVWTDFGPRWTNVCVSFGSYY